MNKTKSWSHGSDLRSWRDERLRISQQAAANKLDISLAAYGKWERGEVIPTQESLGLLVDRLGIPPHVVGYEAPEGWELVPADWIRAELAAVEERARQRHEETMTALSGILDAVRAHSM